MNLRRTGKDEPYYRINNQHIFIQLRGQWMERIQMISEFSHQRIHLFELNPLFIMDNIKFIIEKVSDNSKVIIHIPSQMKDAKKYLEYILSDTEWDGHNKHWAVVLDGKPVSFVWDNWINQTTRTRRSFTVKFTSRDSLFQVMSYISSRGFSINDSVYYEHGPYGAGAIDTVFKRRFPDLFKEDIIKQFKKTTPKEIVKSFTNDEDIWAYITDNDNWE